MLTPSRKGVWPNDPVASSVQLRDEGLGGVLNMQQADLAVLYLGTLPSPHLVSERRHERVVVRKAVFAEQVGQDDVGKRRALVGGRLTEDLGCLRLTRAVGGAVAGLDRIGIHNRR